MDQGSEGFGRGRVCWNSVAFGSRRQERNSLSVKAAKVRIERTIWGAFVLQT